MTMTLVKQVTKIKMEEIRDNAEQMEEDFPGQRKEYVRTKAIEVAVSLADEVIMDAAAGDVEELNLMTACVSGAFLEKLDCALRNIAFAKDAAKAKNDKDAQPKL